MAVFDLDPWLRAQRLPPAFRDTVERAVAPLAARVAIEARRRGRGSPWVVGLCGAQGGGKSTIADLLARLLETDGFSVAALSLDDLYLTHGERAELARTRHRLLATRGPPGTHDVALGLRLLDALGRPGQVASPRFDKASDTRTDPASWPRIVTPVDVVVFEGWCVGARPQSLAELAEPLNALERDEDADGGWRRHVNERLAGDYQALFARIDRLVLLQAPRFDQVLAWRALQERKLADRLALTGAKGGRAAMDAAALARFVMHYERLTRAILAEMPARADVVIRLGLDREVVETRGL